MTMTHQQDAETRRASGKGGGREPIGDPDGETGDFAEEHENTEVTTAEADDEGEPESPDRWTGGMNREGPP